MSADPLAHDRTRGIASPGKSLLSPWPQKRLLPGRFLSFSRLAAASERFGDQGLVSDCGGADDRFSRNPLVSSVLVSQASA